ncbi:unnamed protein product [Phytomonas sp. EM1]|nr:unnamed protein product [Phytomonas sp. EM1]|eukprot:CCW62189.1 unnamed protein product [Phytomonas sp. isolate EM1]
MSSNSDADNSEPGDRAPLNAGFPATLGTPWWRGDIRVPHTRQTSFGFVEEPGRERPDLEGSVSHSNRTSPESKQLSIGGKNDEEIDVLLCADCRFPLASVDEILHEYAEKAWRKHVFAYELDLFGNDRPIWTYSATNPNANRFDVVRVQPEVTIRELAREDLEKACAQGSGISMPPPLTDPEEELRGLRKVSTFDFYGPYSAEHSFFTGYEWCFCNCLNCLNFVGWGFISHEKIEAHRRQTSARQPPSSQQPDAEMTALRVPRATLLGGRRELTPYGRPPAERLPPDFVGLVVTRCTGCSDCSRVLFQGMVQRADALKRRLQRPRVDEARPPPRQINAVAIDNRTMEDVLRDITSLPFVPQTVLDTWDNNSHASETSSDFGFGSSQIS